MQNINNLRIFFQLAGNIQGFTKLLTLFCLIQVFLDLAVVFFKEMSPSGVSFVIYQLFRRYWFFVYFLNKAFQKIILQKEASDEQVSKPTDVCITYKLRKERRKCDKIRLRDQKTHILTQHHFPWLGTFLLQFII